LFRKCPSVKKVKTEKEEKAEKVQKVEKVEKAEKVEKVEKVKPATAVDIARIWLTVNLNVFCAGLNDTFSIHRTIPILVNDLVSARLTAQILATNTALLLGSIYFYNRGLGPLLHYMKTNIGDEVPAVSYADQLGWVIYQGLWLLPICGLCYGCSTAWYQDLADSTYRYLKGVPKSTPLTKSVGQALYGTLVWLCAFIQVKLLAMVVPMFSSQMSTAVDLLFLGWTTQAQSASITNVAVFLQHMLLSWIYGISFMSRCAGLAFLCIMYGWYGFEPKWIASGLDPDARFAILEKHWAYFLGFGFPYVLLMENTSFFVGYGTFLALFPFCIMLGSVCDYSAPYRAYSDASTQHTIGSNILPVFRAAKDWTLLAIKYIDKQAYVAQNKKKINYDETDKVSQGKDASRKKTQSKKDR